MPDPEHVRSARDVYDHSAGRYADLVGTTVTSQFETAIDRAILDAFAEDVSSRGQGPVLDIGCGPGRVTGYLAERGLDISGVDISPRMIATARSAHPGLRFDVGSLTELPVADGSLLGAVLWYSIIHTPFAELRAAWES